MKSFEAYANYYDAFYGDKDYERECGFVESVFRTFAAGRPVHRVLDLGCGTGGHAIPLSRRGYAVSSVDRSPQMLQVARAKAEQAGLSLGFHEGDICSLDLGQTFDAVISMFAVFSYQTGNADLAAAFASARRHLAPGGLFLFDVWFGPAVLAQRPSDRIKSIDTGEERIIRLARPELDILQHTVRVNYQVLRIRGDRVLDEVAESHPMRFLFPQEIVHYLQQTGFRLLHWCPFMEIDRAPTEQDWDVSIVAAAE